MKQFFARGLVVMAGVVSLPGSFSHLPHRTATTAVPVPVPQQDSRLETLQNFFREIECPALQYAETFLEAADDNDLDWRLLPGIAYVESTCGKMAKNNNLFGWDSGRAGFPSPVAAIRSVAERLTHSPLYRNKSVDQILTTYNRNAEYAQKVKSVMQRIAASE